MKKFNNLGAYFEVYDQVRLKPFCSATETNKSLYEASLDVGYTKVRMHRLVLFVLIFDSLPPSCPLFSYVRTLIPSSNKYQASIDVSNSMTQCSNADKA